MSPDSKPVPPGTPPPGPKPSGPTGPTPTGPPTRSALAEIDQLLRTALALVAALPQAVDRVETCGQEIARHRLRMARKAIADLQQYTQTPARQPLSSAPAVAGGPVQPTRMVPGERLVPGSGAAFSGAATESAAAVVARSAGTKPRAGEPPLPGADFLLPNVRREAEFAVGVAAVYPRP